VKLKIRESDMKYNTYGNWKKAYDVLVGEKGYTHDEAQEIIFNIQKDYKYNPNSNDSIMRRVKQVLPKDEYEKEFRIKDTFGESKLHEMTSDEQREQTKQLKADVRDLLDRVKFERIPEATMAIYETDKKGFREALIDWAIECDGGNGNWTIDKIYVGSLEGKAPILYKFNNALSLIMLTTGNGAIVKIAKSGSTRIDPPWTKLDAMQTLYSWLKEYVDQ
jgi:hypothetical protein